MGVGGRRVVNAAAYSTVRLGLRFESPVMAMVAGKKLTARIAPLFIEFRRNGTIDAYQTAKVPDVIFALLLAVAISSFAAVYAVDYGAQAVTAVMATVSLAMLAPIFQRGVAAGVVEG